MFVGHYSVAFAIKKAAPTLPLWLLFVSVQFLDYVHFVLKALNLEYSTVDPHLVGPLALDLHYMPLSHSLAAAVVMSLAAAVLASKFYSMRAGLLLGLAVFSHWLLDFVVHTPDLPILFDSGTKLGLGLWTLPVVALVAEIFLFLAAACYAHGFAKNISFAIFLAAMVIMQIFFAVTTPPTDPLLGSMSALVLYTMLAYGAYRASLGTPLRSQVK